MKRMQQFCDNCAGVGYTTIWKVDSEGTETGTCTKTESICPVCNGKGWTEYAVFSVEEAEAILKHCGLNTES